MNPNNFLRHPLSPFWEEILPYGTAQNAPTGVTTLVPFTDYGSAFSALAWVLKNDDATNPVDAVADVSQGGVGKNGELTQTKTVPAGEERMIMFSPGDDKNPHTYHRLQANNSGATLLIRFALLGIRR